MTTLCQCDNCIVHRKLQAANARITELELREVGWRDGKATLDRVAEKQAKRINELTDQVLALQTILHTASSATAELEEDLKECKAREIERVAARKGKSE